MFDFENLALRCFYGNSDVEPESECPNYDYWEYITFNSIYRMLFKERIHEVVLALDSNSWRKIVYPHYKAHRKKKKEESKVNWNLYAEKKQAFLNKVQEYLPFKVISVNRAEADDILGTLINHKKTENAIIVSMDADYLQLSDKCRIYSPIKKEYVKVSNVEKFLLYTSLCGQKKDNIFNVKTPWDWPEERKKPPFGEKGIDKLILNDELDKFLDTPIEYEFKDEEEKVIYASKVLPREMYNINRKLIDFTFTPKVMADKTIDTYENYNMNSSPDKLYEFFRIQNWKEALENFTQVESKLLELY
jgi:hypothetical protein